MRPLLPLSLRQQALEWAHGLSHAGVGRTALLLKERFFWPRLKATVAEYVGRCVDCLRRKPPQPRLGLMGGQPPQKPWHTVAMDFCGPYIKSEVGNRFVLVFVDQFTKWVELVPLPDSTAATVVRCFYERIVCRHGCPVRLLSDRGPQFAGLLVRRICAEFGVEKIFSSAYYPQGDGFAERMMRTMNDSLSVLVKKSVRRWDTFLPGVQMAYNCSVHGATGETPFLLNTGRVPRLLGEGERREDDSSEFKVVLLEAQQRARECVNGYWARMKARYDRSRKDSPIPVGTQVLVRLIPSERETYPCRKLAPRWSEPVTVVAVKSNGLTYEVYQESDRKTRVVHGTRLLPLPFMAAPENVEVREDTGKRREDVWAALNSEDEDYDYDWGFMEIPPAREVDSIAPSDGFQGVESASLPLGSGSVIVTGGDVHSSGDGICPERGMDLAGSAQVSVGSYPLSSRTPAVSVVEGHATSAARTESTISPLWNPTMGESVRLPSSPGSSVVVELGGDNSTATASRRSDTSFPEPSHSSQDCTMTSRATSSEVEGPRAVRRHRGR